MRILDWIIDHLPKCFWHISWEGISDHAHYEHPLDRQPEPERQPSLWD